VARLFAIEADILVKFTVFAPMARLATTVTPSVLMGTFLLTGSISGSLIEEGVEGLVGDLIGNSDEVTATDKEPSAGPTALPKSFALGVPEYFPDLFVSGAAPGTELAFGSSVAANGFSGSPPDFTNVAWHFALLLFVP